MMVCLAHYASFQANWGDVPTWCLAGLTLVAVLAAIYAGKKAADLLGVERDRDEFQNEERREEAERRARAEQADLVAAWHDRSDDEYLRRKGIGPSDPASWGCFVLNKSPLPVYDVRLRCIANRDDSVRDSVTLPLLPHGREFIPWTIEFRRHEAGSPADVFTEGLNQFKVELAFRDAAGRRWKRDTSGILTRDS